MLVSVRQIGLCALFMAAEAGDVATVEVLLSFNPDLSIREVNQATVLHAAASGGHVGIMLALLSRGLSASDRDRMGDTPLHWIPGSGTAASVRLLEVRGPMLGFPHTSGINGSRHSHMRELRTQHEGRPLRTLYAFDPLRAAILLIGGDKTGDDRWYETHVPVADRLYDEHLTQLRNEGHIDG